MMERIIIYVGKKYYIYGKNHYICWKEKLYIVEVSLICHPAKKTQCTWNRIPKRLCKYLDISFDKRSKKINGDG